MTPEDGSSRPTRRPGADPAPFISAAGDETPVPPESFRLFGSRPFLRLWLAQVFSSLGDWVGLFAILGITAQLSNNSAAANSLVMAARLLPGFFLATLGGVIVDRFDRRKIMVLCDLGRAALICTVPFVDSLWQLVVVSFFIEIMTLLWGPAKDASVPHFVPEDKLASANTLSLMLRATASCLMRPQLISRNRPRHFCDCVSCCGARMTGTTVMPCSTP